MALDDLPGWLVGWCVNQLGNEPVSVLFERRSLSAVFGLRLAGGRDVVVKAREDDGRAASCLAAQARLADRGFPCARPLTPVVGVALVGAACGAFANVSPPALAPVESSAAFLEAYQDLRGRRFTVEEQEMVWAASLWPAAHNARWEALHGAPRSLVTPSAHRRPSVSAERMRSASQGRTPGWSDSDADLLRHCAEAPSRSQRSRPSATNSCGWACRTSRRRLAWGSRPRRSRRAPRPARARRA